jgi:GNAT superfamily N-acetyltransferase
MNWQRDDYVLTDDRERVDADVVCALLHATYWADQRPRALIEKSIRNSLCFALLHSGQQVGFARAVTDYATFAWICDVIIAPGHRGHGLGKWMVECIVAHPELQNGTQLLRTRDAHTLYERFGFQRAECLRRGGLDLCPRPA